MVANPIHVLLIEDNPGDALLIAEALQDVPTPAFDLEHVDHLALGLDRLKQGNIDVILLDLSLPDSHGLDTLLRTCQHAPAIPVIVLTGLEDNVLEVRAVQAGAQDFLSKNALDGHLLARAIRYAIERKAAEEALRESEAKYRLSESELMRAQAVAHLGNWKWDIRTSEVIWSDEMYRIFGIDKNSYTGRLGEAIAKVIHPDDLHLVLPTNAPAFVEKKPIEYRIILPDGSIRHIWALSGDAVLDDAGHPVFLTGIAQDITERKQADETLRQTNAYLENLINYANAPIIVWDPHFYITRFNHAFEFLTGRTESEVVGQSLEILFPPELAEHSMRLIHETLSGERWETVEIKIRHREGAIRTVLWNSATVFAPDGRTPIATIAQGQDITERKQAEDALRQFNVELEQRVIDRTRQLTEANAQLAQLDQLKDQFISRISHELRTPLTNIIIYLELLETGKPDKRSRYLQVLNEQSALLQKLIENLLEVTQQSVSTVGVHILPIDLNRLAASLASDTAPRAARHGLLLSTSFSPDLPLVSADPLLLAQALSHLATNALNYTPSGGTIDLRTALVIDQGATWVTFTICDTGPGIAPDDLPHIFERFYRGHAAADYKTPGAGIGLSLSRDIITGLGGRLTVASGGAASQGATFTVWLKPAQETQP